MDFTYRPSLLPANCFPSSSKRPGEKQDNMDWGRNRMFHKFIFAHLVLSSVPPIAKHQDEAVTRDSESHRRAL